MVSSTETSNAGDHAVELTGSNSSATIADGGPAVSDSDEITPLLTRAEKPKISIFSVSYPRRKPRDQVTKITESEISIVTQFILWVWSGSRYSGLLCMALSSTVYFIMEVLSDVFSVQSIPLSEAAFTRCTISLLLSYLWLKRSGQPSFGPTHARILLVSRALVGSLSLLSFVYSIQRLPLSQAIVISFTTPIMASVAARIILHEKWKISDIGCLACSFFGVLFTFQQIFTTQVGLVKAGEANNANFKGSHHIYAALVGLLSSITAGISYSLIKAGAKASDQTVVTIFSFGIVASPTAGICMFAFEEFVVPGFYSLFLMLVLGILAFFAEVLLARGLHLEKTSKVANVQYIEAALSQLWSIYTSRVSPSFGRLVGCLLMLVSVCCTMYLGPDKEMEREVPCSSAFHPV